MTTNTKKLTIIQKIALFWLEKTGGLLWYNHFKGFAQWIRLTLSGALIIFTYFFLEFAASLIGGYFEDAFMPQFWQTLGDGLYYGVLIGSALIFTLESLFDIDAAAELKNIKARKAHIKKNKLQFWRLRNMHFFFRILIYFSFYMFCLLIIQKAAWALFTDVFAMAKNTPETHAQIALFMQEYESFTRWFSFIYFISCLVLDYFVDKKRALVLELKRQAQKEVQDETDN